MRYTIGVVAAGCLLILAGGAPVSAGAPCTGLTLDKTISLNGSCPGSDPVDVPPNTGVTYCYTVTNNTGTTYGSHTLIDSQLGSISVPSCTLPPAGTCSATAPATITMSVANTATWTAMTSGASACGADGAQAYVCGNNVVEGTEACDQGVNNGTPASCCSSTCTFLAPGTCDDGDGVAPSTEDGAPNGGDGNDDGIIDSLQSDVTSFPSATGRGYITLVTSGGCNQNQLVAAVTEQSVGSDTAFDYPFGLIRFQLPCPSAVVTVLYHGTSSAPGDVYRKFGPTPPSFNNPGFYTLPGVVFGTTVVNGQTVGTATFTLTDNQLGDGDPTVGLIFDPSGPATLVNHAVPVLSPWALGVVALLLSVVGLLGLRQFVRQH